MKTETKTPSKAKTQDAVELLTADHLAVKKLFDQFKKCKKADGTDDEKSAIVEEICTALTVHAQVEEEIFYPAMRLATDEDDLMDEAQVEQDGAKELIDQLQTMEPGDDMYDAKVIVLSEYIAHHVKEEETGMFPKAKKAKLDLDALGQEMAQRKTELMQELDLPDPPDSEEDEGADPVGPIPVAGGKSKPAPGAQSRTPKTKAA